MTSQLFSNCGRGALTPLLSGSDFWASRGEGTPPTADHTHSPAFFSPTS